MCLEDLSPDHHVTESMCYPSTKRIIEDIRQVVDKANGINAVYIGSDSPPPLEEMRKDLQEEVSGLIFYYLIGRVSQMF